MEWKPLHARSTALLVLLLVATLLRVALALRPGLWVDEVFSLAMATGHSLEHPAREAQLALGDYVEFESPRSAATYQGLLRSESSGSGADRIVRAVFLSDTSPPLYYLLLGGWLQLAGESDAALRLLSVLLSIACFPWLVRLAWDVAGPKAAVASAFLFGLSPPALYYSSEGRMYALTWLLGLLLAWVSLSLARRGPRPGLLAAWCGLATAALLTHYFMIFIVSACFLWLLLHPGRLSRAHIVCALLVSVAFVLPWFVNVPESLLRWRVSAGWLDQPLDISQIVFAPFLLAWSFLSGYWVWNGSILADALAALLWCVVIGGVVRQGLRRAFTPPLQLFWLCVLFACAGPLAFDLVRGSSASTVLRYALPGLPFGHLLAGAALGWLSPRIRLPILAGILVAWLPGVWCLFNFPPRPAHRLPEVAQWIRQSTRPGDLVVVHSVPSGVLGLARYLDPETPVFSWAPQLGQRSPDQLKALLAGRCGVALAKIHHLGTIAPAELWLEQRFGPSIRERLGRDAEVMYYDLASASCASRQGRVGH